MRKTCLSSSWSWGFAVVLLCCMGMAAAAAAQGRQVGMVSSITLTSCPLSSLVRAVSEQSGVNIQVLASDEPRVTLTVKSPTPVEVVLQQIADQRKDLYYTKVPGGYQLVSTEQPANVTSTAVTPVTTIAPLPTDTGFGASIESPVQQGDNPTFYAMPPQPAPAGAPQPTSNLVIKSIPLQHSSAREIAWMLGVKQVNPEDARRKKVLQQRIRVMFDFRDQTYYSQYPKDGTTPAPGYLGVGGYSGSLPSSTYGSPAVNPYSAPTGNVSLRNSATNPLDGHQYAYDPYYGGGQPPYYGSSTPYYGGSTPYYGSQPGYGTTPYYGSQPGYGTTPYYGTQPGYGTPYGTQPGYGTPYYGTQPGYGTTPYYGTQPGYPQPGYPQPGTTQPGYPPTTTTPGTPGTQTADEEDGGTLKEYIPKGIQQIVGLIGLNSLLVMAQDDDSMKQFEALIKALDQPVKQAIVEVMFVKMEIKDAMSLGSAWEFANTPFSISNNNDFGAVSGGNFLARYVKGNLRVALGSLITNQKANVVNSPRVIVPNGGQASFMMEDSVPFIYMNEETDIFGRSYSTPTVYMQVFSQGLVVNDVTIHPDDSVTLRVDPILEAPLGSVELPGGEGTTATLLGYSRATIDTQVRVKSGETIMMGGFISKDDQSDSTRAPLLSNLPIVGPMLFGGKKETKSNTEVMIFVTPIVVKDDATDFQHMQMPPPLW